MDFNNMRPQAHAQTPGPNLFLRHLPPMMMEQELEALLLPHGRLKRLTVWKDHKTRQSKGFGMAEFEQMEGAIQAMKHLNGRELNEGATPLELEYHHGKRRRDGTPDIGAPCTNVYIRGLPRTMTEDQLRDVLRKYGDIKRLTIWKDQFGHSKGFGMCEYGTASQARYCLEQLRGQSLDNHEQLHIEVNPPKIPAHQRNDPFMNSNHAIPNIFIKGFPISYNENDLRDLVSQYGMVKRVTIWRDRSTGESKGFGLVEFADVQMATNMLSALNGATIGGEGSGNILQVEYNHPRSKNPSKPGMVAGTPGTNIFIKSLPLTFTDADLHSLLSQYGRIIRSTIWKDTHTKQSRGFGFCEYANAMSAMQAIRSLDGVILHGSVTPVHVELHGKQPNRDSSSGLSFGAQGTSTNIFIKGLPKRYSETELKAMLEPHGRIVRCTVWKDRNTKESRGFGMAEFDTVTSATISIQQLNGVQLPESNVPLTLEFHPSHNQPPAAAARPVMSHFAAPIHTRPTFP